MSRPKLFDWYCCAGGAGKGYARAGFDVYGVDIVAQPNYPFWFHRGDVLRVGERLLSGKPVLFTRRFPGLSGESTRWVSLDEFAAGHASPPCQSYSDLAKRNGNGHEWPRLIAPTRLMLRKLGVPYVIENVEGAELEMIRPITLCGTMFQGLRVLRHRLFETNFPVKVPPHPSHPLVFTHDKRKAHYGRLDQNTSYVQVTGGGNCTIANARAAMGIDWMTKAELNEAIPPAYTEHIGAQLIRSL